MISHKTLQSEKRSTPLTPYESSSEEAWPYGKLKFQNKSFTMAAIYKQSEI